MWLKIIILGAIVLAIVFAYRLIASDKPQRRSAKGRAQAQGSNGPVDLVKCEKCGTFITAGTTCRKCGG